MIFTFFSNLVHIVNLLTIFYMIFKENRSSKSIISWTLVLIILPYIGFILFLMLCTFFYLLIKTLNRKVYLLKQINVCLQKLEKLA